MGLQNNNITIYPTSGYSPSFSWQVGFNDINAISNNLNFRATIRPLHGFEDYTRVPNSTILYEETGIIINNATSQGQWTFPLEANAQLTGGPYRDYQVVIEAHDSDGNTSAGNIVETSDENGWVKFNQGYDIIAIENPRQTGIEMSNNLPTQYSSVTGNTGNVLDTGFYLNSGHGYNSLNYMDAHGGITIRYLGGQFNSNLVGGYIYAWTGQFPKLDTALGTNGYNQVSKSQFDFNPTLGIVDSRIASMKFRGANNVYVSLSFYDNIDQIAIDKGIDISTGLYLSDNVICYNDISAGSITIGGFQSIYAMQYSGVAATGILGTGASILSQQSNSGITSVLYLASAINTVGYSSYSGHNSLVGGGAGGSSVLLNNSPITPMSAASAALIPMMISNSLPNGVASASLEYTPAYYAFDGTGTAWSANDFAPQWLEYQFSTPKTISSYNIYFSTIITYTYTLKGSNDGFSWTDIDSQTTVHGGTFVVTPGMSYSYYRIQVYNATYLGSPYPVAIDSLQLYGV